MPISIVGLGGSGPARTAPVVSGLVEFGSALHVLRDPGHHGAEPWAAAVRAVMSPELAGWTESWSWTTQAIRSAPFVTAPPRGDEFCDRLGGLRAVPARRLAGQLLRPISPSRDARAAPARAPARRPARSALAGEPGNPPAAAG